MNNNMAEHLHRHRRGKAVQVAAVLAAVVVAAVGGEAVLGSGSAAAVVAAAMAAAAVVAATVVAAALAAMAAAVKDVVMARNVASETLTRPALRQVRESTWRTRAGQSAEAWAKGFRDRVASRPIAGHGFRSRCWYVLECRDAPPSSRPRRFCRAL